MTDSDFKYPEGTRVRLKASVREDKNSGYAEFFKDGATGIVVNKSGQISWEGADHSNSGCAIPHIDLEPIDGELIPEGSTVRVTLEALLYGDTTDAEFRAKLESVPGVTVTDLEVDEPVETFGPGDIVRGVSSGYIYTLTDGGYYCHLTNVHYYDDHSEFTSHAFERVA